MPYASSMLIVKQKKIIIVGGGPAGLMAAENIALAGYSVDLYDAMPTVGRKFLLAGIGGMNITHSEELDCFITRYRERQVEIQTILKQMNAEELIEWVHGLGIETFIGSSGRVFPKEMKAAPLLRAWIKRLKTLGVKFYMRHQWMGWQDEQLIFKNERGHCLKHADAVVLALGGASWPKLGSDGIGLNYLKDKGIAVKQFKPSNCGFHTHWSDFFKEKFQGEILKTVSVNMVDIYNNSITKQSQIVITELGIEGSLIYALSAPIRELIERDGSATIYLDLVPDKDQERVYKEVSAPRGSKSLSSHLRSKLGIDALKTALLYETLDTSELKDGDQLALKIKRLPIKVTASFSIEEAISSAGGVLFEELNAQLMSHKHQGVFIAGEMLDWEAPTGGYLLTACFASGRVAGLGVIDYLEINSNN